MSKRLLLFFLLLLFQIAPFSHISARADELDSRLGTTVSSYRIDANSFPEALMRVAEDFRIPMGIQWVSTPAARVRLTLSLSDATVSEILDAVAKTQSGYEVVVSNGVVHVFPPDIAPHQNFVLLKVKSFEVHNQTVQMAARELRAVVMSMTIPPKEGGGGIGGSLITNVGEPRIDISLSNATVERALDSLAVASAKKIWVVTFADNPVPTAAGFRRTLALRNSSPVPDDEQPVWDMFSWYEVSP